MDHNFYDTELIHEFKKLHSDDSFKVLESQFYIDLINNKFPFLGSRIDFSKSKKHQYTHLNKDNLIINSSNFINNIITDNSLDICQEIIYIGDGVTECAYKFKLKNLVIFLPAILENPQHHYFVDKNYNWCLFISFENDIDFGIF